MYGGRMNGILILGWKENNKKLLFIQSRLEVYLNGFVVDLGELNNLTLLNIRSLYRT